MIKRLPSYCCSRFAVVTVSIAMQAVLAAIGASPAFANYPYFVNSLADTVSSDGVCTLREAMFAANNNPINGDCGLGSPEFDTIFIFVPGTIVLGAALPDITEGVAILGHDSGGTTIDGNSRVRPFVIRGSGQLSSVVVRLEKLTITNAKAPNGNVASPRGEDGGAIHNSAQLHLRDVRITHSGAGNGGAGVGEGGHGGAIYNAGAIVAYRVTFDRNSSGDGISVPGDVGIPKTITKSGIGGAIYNAPGSGLILYAGTFTRNSGRTANVLYTLGPAIIKSSTIDSSYLNYEAAIVTDGPGQVLLSSTIIDTVYDCKALASPGSFIDGGYNLPAIMTDRCGFTAAAGSFQSFPSPDPVEPELQNNGGYIPTLALVPSSVALNRVPASFQDCADGMLLHIGLPFDLTDARGVARPRNGNCDVGAFELGPSFRRGVRTLAISGAGTGQGTVSGGGLACAIAGGATSGQCSAEYGPGTVVTPTATAAAGSIFVGWAGDLECADGSVLMDGDKHCIAIFDLRPLSVSGAAKLSISGSANRLEEAHPPKSAGRAEVTFDAEFAVGGAIDLGAATVTINALLNEEGPSGAGELVEGVPIVLQAIPGGGSTAAIFETAAGVAPRVTVEVSIAPRSLSVAIAIEEARLVRFPELCATVTLSATTLTTSFTVDDGINPPLTVTAREPWRCLAATAGNKLQPRLLRTQ